MILIVDDGEATLTMLARSLESAGYDVTCAENGQKGLDSFRCLELGLVIADLFMPEVEGIEMLRQMRKENSDVPIIAMSGGSALVPTEVLHVAQRLGAARTLVKPVGCREIIQCVNALLQERTSLGHQATASGRS